VQLCCFGPFTGLGKDQSLIFEQIQVQSMTDQELEHIKVPMIKAKAINQFSGNFFTLRLDRARKAFEEMPWVREAGVRRSYGQIKFRYPLKSMNQ
jgi:cell division protein FtsQ